MWVGRVTPSGLDAAPGRKPCAPPGGPRSKGRFFTFAAGRGLPALPFWRNCLSTTSSHLNESSALQILPVAHCFPRMKKITLLAAGVICLLATPLLAQALPPVKLQLIFPKLTIERPVWMSEAPDGSGRL